MRSFVIVYVQERIKALLLLQEVEGGGFGGFFFQGQVHTFMAGVLLRLAGLDAFDADAELQPPDGKPAESEQGMGAGEGNAVIGADGVGQAEGLEGVLEHLKGTVFLGGFEALAGEQVAASLVGDGQRVAVFAIAQQELALEVGTPQRIGRQGLAERRAPGLVALAFASFHQAVAVQYHVDGADRWRLDDREHPGQLVADLGRTPAGIVPLDADNGLLDLEGQFVRVTVGAP